MNEETRKELTLFLGECWHVLSQDGMTCLNCHKLLIIPVANRTFTTESDMMALYRRLWKMGKWQEFFKMTRNLAFNSVKYEHDFIAWLLCLSGEGYEDRCEMVAEFLRRE